MSNNERFQKKNEAYRKYRLKFQILNSPKFVKKIIKYFFFNKIYCTFTTP